MPPTFSVTLRVAQLPPQPAIRVVDLSETLDELPDLDPQPQRATNQQAAVHEAYVVLERLDEDLVMPQLPLLLVTPPPYLMLSIDWNQLDYQLVVFDNQEPQPPQPQIQMQQPQPLIDWGLIAVALINLANMEREANLLLCNLTNLNL